MSIQTPPDEKMKHLEFTQGIINRLSQKSFIIRGWTISLVSALLAIATGDLKEWSLQFVAIAVIGVFWYLDAFYLRLERKYRILYDMVRLDEVPQFDLNARSCNDKNTSWSLCLTAIQICLVYLSLSTLFMLAPWFVVVKP